MEAHTINPSHFKNKEALPAVVRFGVPLFFIGVICILLPSDIGSGVSFDATIDGTGLEIQLITVSVFSSVKELWKAGSYAIAFFIVLFSISWPYTNLLLSIMYWMKPWKNSDMKRREAIVALLDALGKWGVFDTLVLIILMVSLNFHTSPAALGLQAIVETQAESSVDVEENSLRTWLTPLWGFYGFFAAALLSLVGTNLLMFFQRKAFYSNESAMNLENGSTSKIPFSERSGVPITNPNQLILTFFLLAVLLITGFFLKVIRYTFTTTVGENSFTYSLFDYGLGLRDTPLPGTGTGGPLFMVIVYYFMCLVMPPVNLLVLAALFLRPMTVDRQKFMFYIAETTFAWCAAGPLILSLFIATDQVPRFANSVISANCVNCLKVESELQWGAMVYLLGAVGHGFTAYYLMHKTHNALYSAN